MNAFQYARAPSLAAAAEALAAEPRARILAGGTDLVPELKRRLAAPPLLVDIKRAGAADPGLGSIVRLEDGTVRIGALVTLAEIAAHPLVAGTPIAAIAEACASAATPALRNVATIGGNLLQSPRCWYYRAGVPCVASGASGCPARDGDARFHAIFPPSTGSGRAEEDSIDVHPSDPATALALLGARVVVRGASGPTREVALAELLPGAPTPARPRFHALAPGEAVAAILVPPPAAGFRSVYEKGMSRETWSFALAAVAAGGVLGADGKLEKVSLALGGVAAAPVLAADLDAILASAKPHPESAYKIALVRGLAARALDRLRTK